MLTYAAQKTNDLRREFLSLISILLLMAGTNDTLAYQELDKAIALVEESVILQSQLDQRLTHLSTKNPGTPITDSLKRQVIDQLIAEQLQLNVANRIKLEISPGEVEQKLQEFTRRLNSEGQSLEDYLATQNISETQFRQAIKDDVTRKKLQQGNINRRLKITEREIDEFLASKAGQEWLKTRFRLAHILLPVNDNQDGEAIATAQALYRDLQENQADFQTLATQNSKGPNAAKGGDLGWRAKNELPSLFIEQVATLKVGDVTRPFRSGAGVHLLKVLQRSGAEPVMVERYKVRHILIKPTELFTEIEAKAKVDKLHQEILDGADFATLAKAHTDDTGSKADGGDVGWSTPGQFVPEFERTMKTTPMGEMSQPFRSQFGWHILMTEDRRTEDMFDVVKRNQVVSILRQRRFQDELQLWLQELREDAYVEVLI